MDIAAEMKFFSDQLSLNIDYFTENRSNILTSKQTIPDYVAVTLTRCLQYRECEK